MYSVGVNEKNLGMAYYEMGLLMKEYHEIQTILEDIGSTIGRIGLNYSRCSKATGVKAIGIKTAEPFWRRLEILIEV